MSTVTFDGAAATSNPADQRSKSDALHIAALGLLSIRFIQGFIYWDGGSRRFIYAPAKLDPHAANWMANKLQSAMPGRCVGTDHIIAFLLHHFHLLYASLILFSAAELITGLFLMAGFPTRAAALTSIGLSVVLMLMFGWQGATCIDGIESFCALQMSPTQAAFPPGLVSQLFGPTKQSCAQGDISRSHPLF
jgi:thiosulfate dehydrogenase [quinone] large subunit